MAKITFVLEDELEKRFRRILGNSGPYRRGMMQEALNESVELWIKEKRGDRA